MVKEKSLTQLNFNIVKLKFTLIILLVFSFQVLSQTLDSDQIRQIADKTNEELPFNIPGSGGVVMVNATSFGRNIIYTYEVPSDWFPYDDAKEQIINNLSDEQKQFFFRQKINLNYNYMRDNNFINRLFISYKDLDIPNIDDLGDYLSYKSHPKAKGVNIKIKNPLAFEKLEGDRPNVVAKYNNSENNLVYTLVIGELPTFFSRQDTRDYVFVGDSNSLAKEMTDDFGGSLVSSRFLEIDRYPAIEYIYDISRELFDGKNITMRSIAWQIYYEDRVISINAGTEKDRFEKNKYVFYKITNSILFEDQYNYPGSERIYNNDNFLEFVDKFYRDINFFGIYKNRPREISIRLEPLDTFKGTNHYHGISFGYNDDSKIDIIINERSWNSFTKAQKHYLIYHELCHDVLNLDDLSVNTDKNSIMYPSIHNFKDLDMDDFIVNFQMLMDKYYE